MKYIKITLDGSGLTDTLDGAVEFLKTMYEEEMQTEGYKYKFQVVEMTEKEYKSLPEFDGF